MISTLAFIGLSFIQVGHLQTARPKIELNLPIGTEFSGTLSLKFTDANSELELITKDTMKSTVAGIDGDIYTIKHLVTPSYEKIDGVERPLNNPEPTLITETRTKRGIIRSYIAEGIDDYANQLIARFWTLPLPSLRPVIGSDWSFTDFRTHPYTFTGKVIREVDNNVDLEVSFASTDSQDPVSAKGTATLDSKTGLPIKIQLKVANGLVPGGEQDRVSIDFVYECGSIKLPQ